MRPSTIHHPPSTSLGILGGGQLAQMLALAALPLGVRTLVLEPDPQAPARLCATHLCAPYTDPEALDRLAQCDAVTLEFENVPLEALERLAGRVPVRPGGPLLAQTKHRALEKTAVQAAGVPTAPFVVLEQPEDLPAAAEFLTAQGRGILKTAELGYDGKGQQVLQAGDDISAVWQALGRVPGVLEGWVPFERELSLAVARSAAGDLAFGPLIENVHRNGILRTSVFPAGAGSGAEAEARATAQRLAEALRLEGLLTIEFFELPSGELLVNELAPRVHNSGHLTQDGGGISQFEAQVRAVLNLPLCDWAPLRPCAMVNDVGVEGRQTDWDAIAHIPQARRHSYHKAWRAGRKLGHVNIVANDPEELRRVLAQVEGWVP